MSDTPSEWCLVAVCSSCRQALSIAATAVLVRDTVLGPRGVVIDVLGARWPEPGLLLHPRCFMHRFGRRALWMSFVRGRFDKGVPRAGRRLSTTPKNVPATDPAGWTLTVICCQCGAQIGAAGAAVVRDERTRNQWLWVPVMRQRRPGQRQVAHLQCFIKTHGRRAAYAALGREAWERLGPIVKQVGGAINPSPF